ncbi:hypothetical protein ARMGADRAFT_1037008 [Armillaria gallica]|uniref:Uncharacterized protein n=1 Tax=Armillaria gallica TaxID=47427 RepID=A0A2H3D152_ARMGA|nr:hypothetical protein ARMGADRAFT_1037008 [Armillaria gallica]
MQTVIDQFIADWSNILELYHQFKPPPFMPLASNNIVTNAKGANHGAGLVFPINGTLDEWCRYAAHHFHPAGRSTPIGIRMDMASQFHLGENYVYTWLSECPPPWDMPPLSPHQPTPKEVPGDIGTMDTNMTSNNLLGMADEEDMAATPDRDIEASMTALSMSWDAIMEGSTEGLETLDWEDGFTSYHQL